MKYTVVWSRRAYSALAEIWLDRPGERDEIRRSSDSVDQLLSDSPLEQGESRDQDRRVLFLPPLVIIFRVDENSRVVRVLNIREMRRRYDR